MVISMITVDWYWTFHKRNIPNCSILTATETIVRYHLGTVAFGWIILVFEKFSRFYFEIIDRFLNKIDYGFPNILIFTNQNILIGCAITGKRYIDSAIHLSALAMTNIIRVSVMGLLTQFLVFVFMCLVTASTMALTYLMFLPSLTKEMVVDSMVPVIAVGILTFFTSRFIFGVYNVIINTLIWCCLEDLDTNDGTRKRPYYMSDRLKEMTKVKNDFPDHKYNEKYMRRLSFKT